MKRAILKPGREKSLERRHPWIFSGAIAELPLIAAGEVLDVYSSAGTFLAKAYFHPDNSLTGRVLTFKEEPIEAALKERLAQAIELRKSLFNSDTTAYRLVNGEGDGLPGLIIDRYGDVLVLQISTWGMERLKPLLISLLHPYALYEKSTATSRAQEGLPPSEGWLSGTPTPDITILENGMQFKVSFADSQKTGLFLDQREMRRFIESQARGRNVLNGFSYTGGFSLFALRGGARSATSVDSCPTACAQAKENSALNGLSSHEVLCEDLFSFLRRPLPYDLIILDPPAFAKKRADVDTACRGYKEINRQALAQMPPKSFLLTCSCSYHIDSDLFQMLLFQSAREAERSVRILSTHQQALDHPTSLFHPEGSYLKSLYLFVE